jgi:hypothetical protein
MHLRLRFYVDPDSRAPHIYQHHVTEEEVEEILLKPVEDRRGRDQSRVVLGRTAEGRHVRVIYVPDPHPGSAFVVTAYDLTGKPLAAYRRRLRRRGKR